MWPGLLVGLAGVLSACALPFAPVFATTTTVTWPSPGHPVNSSSAVFAPYRPTELKAAIPCSALRAGSVRANPVEVFATGTAGDGMVLTSGPSGVVLQLDDRTLPLALPTAGVPCRIELSATPEGLSLVGADGPGIDLPGVPVPRVFGFRTALDPTDAAGLVVTVRTTDPFTTSPGALKRVLIGLQLAAVVVVLVMLRRSVEARSPRPRPVGWRPVWWVDLCVLAVLGLWAIIGPLAVDDGWAMTIARNFAASGNPGNYYRWWNASEVPFAFSQELLSPLTQVSIAPLWLRLPSTLLAVATWFVLSRGVLGAALPFRSATMPIRILAAACLLAAWLPFDLGTRPESYVALGVTAALALAWRARTLPALGALALTCGLTIPISPNGLLVLAPILVFAPRIVAALRSTSRSSLPLVGHLLMLSCVAAVGLTVIFADQTWDALVTATDWHAFFGPTLAWYDEPVRYHLLLQADQQGSAPKRLPVLLAIAMLPIVAMLTVRRKDRDPVGRATLRLAFVVAVALMLFAGSPSKWSYHFGAAAGLFAAFLTVAVALAIRRSRTPDRFLLTVCAAGSILLCMTVALAFDGPNAWWLPILYDVPWASESPRPLGIPLNNPVVWIGLLGGVVAVAIAVSRPRALAFARALTRGPAIVTLTALAVVLALLLVSFATAPLRRPEGSLATANVNRLTGRAACGLADDVQVLPDGPILSPSDGNDESTGFVAQGGYPPDAPPPDVLGAGISTYLWGSFGSDSSTATLTTRWFILPPQPANGGVAVSISGRTDEANALALQFGRTDGFDVAPLGERTPPDRVPSDEDPAHPQWRSIGVDATDIPAGADRVRIRAMDGRSDQLGWLAVSGPRLRSVIGLNEFLAGHGPVLISWPQSFLFPCVRNIASVGSGMAQTPQTVIEPPRPWLAEDRERGIGGTFAALKMFGALYEVPSRLVGHPEVDWGAVRVAADPAARDDYQRVVTRTLIPGLGGVIHQQPER